jgi:hypothetical protein
MSLAPKNRKKGKRVEKAIAKRLDGIRVGILGAEDVLTEQFAIEVKTRKKFVALSWYQQAVKNAKKNKIPLLIVHISNKHHDNDLVILSLKDFEKLINFNKNP